jgi:hypothetical protein
MNLASSDMRSAQACGNRFHPVAEPLRFGRNADSSSISRPGLRRAMWSTKTQLAESDVRDGAAAELLTAASTWAYPLSLIERSIGGLRCGPSAEGGPGRGRLGLPRRQARSWQESRSRSPTPGSCAGSDAGSRRRGVTPRPSGYGSSFRFLRPACRCSLVRLAVRARGPGGPFDHNVSRPSRHRPLRQGRAGDLQVGRFTRTVEPCDPCGVGGRSS